MTVSLGLDIGSNSVGSAWVDTKKWLTRAAVSVFPAGVTEEEEARGAPKNQERRSKRSLRRSLSRRSARKRRLRQFLAEQGLLPKDPDELKELFALDPWELRRHGLDAVLTPHQFGRVLLHLCQRRGALGLIFAEEAVAGATDDESANGKAAKEESDDQAVKAAVQHTIAEKNNRDARTFGELISKVAAERRHPVLDTTGNAKLDAAGQPITFAEHVRNRLGEFEFHADRGLIRDEFLRLWEKQSSLGSELAGKLSEELKLALDDPRGDLVWRHRGLLFGQRRTYWRIETLGRCDLEPTDRCVPIMDRHASWFRVVESVNNIRLKGPGDVDYKPLSADQRDKVIAKLRTQKTGSVATVRGALGIDKKSLKKLENDLPESAYVLNIERDEGREINTDWFHREIVLAGLGEDVWNSWDEARRNRLNRAILRFDPRGGDDERFLAAARRLGLDDLGTSRLVEAWRKRPPLERRLKLSRRALLNLLPFMEIWDKEHGRWPTQIEARQEFGQRLAERLATLNENDRPPEDVARERRYRLGGTRRNKADRYFQKKHPNLLPPAPTLANPVVRKAIHEVRRHVIAHMKANGGHRPDQVVIEFARETTKPKKESDRLLYLNRNRNKIRKRIQDEVVRPAFGDANFHQLTSNQLRAAVDRVVLCVQQRNVCAYSTAKLDGKLAGHCAYSGKAITLRQAALGTDLEVDHIIPYSRCGDNSLNNRVLCYRNSNRDKQQQTPREWWQEDFDGRITPLRFMDGHRPEKGDYFTSRDYVTKWRNLSRKEVPSEWKGSQLSDTAYAAREVQTYLQQALWPDEPTHLEGGQRRIFVTKGRYTRLLRQDWQLYQKLITPSQASPEEMSRASAKNRGDHREHAIDAVAIALTDPSRILELADTISKIDEERAKAKAQGREPSGIRRQPIPPPWKEDLKSFRRRILRQLYDSFDDIGKPLHDEEPIPQIVVCHRAAGRKLTGAFHEETLFGPVPGSDTLFTGHKAVDALTPKHLRMPVPEKREDAIKRLAENWFKLGKEPSLAQAKRRAKAFVSTTGYQPRLVDPPTEKSGLVRDVELRRILRAQISLRLRKLGLKVDADSFTKGELAKILKKENGGPLRMPSGVPIRRVVLLRTMNDPARIERKRFDYSKNRRVVDDAPRAGRAYVGGNNHHLEIREDINGRWSGYIMPTFKAAQRVRQQRLTAVDQSDDAERGGRFIMSLAEGETVYMRHKVTGEPAYFVVFKLDKPQTAFFKAHWDARRATGEKDESGKLIPGSERVEMQVSATDLKALAPPGEATPIKVVVDPLGHPRRVEPAIARDSNDSPIDPRVLEIAHIALQSRGNRTAAKGKLKRGRQKGSWSWMLAELDKRNLSALAPQLSAALRTLRKAR